MTFIRIFLRIFLLLSFSVAANAEGDPLPSWNDGAAKQAVVDFVQAATNPSSPAFVPQDARIATFDNDGTLWPSHPMYIQLAFAMDRVKQLAPQHPEWKTTQPFKAVLENDLATLTKLDDRGILELVMASHAGMTTAEFEAIVAAWFKTARHPRFQKPYTELAYQPMLELLAYLRSNGFKTYIVSAGGVEFMRPMTQEVYGVPPEQVVGSSIQTKFEIVDGKPVLMRQPKLGFDNDKAGKPVAINEVIGRRPIAAFGNSRGDKEMLEWVDAGDKAKLMMLIFHDDAQREYAYGPADGLADTSSGTFPQSLMDEAHQKNWVVVRMKDDWRTIFPSNSAK